MQTGPTRSMLQTLVSAVKLEGLRKGAYVGLSASLARQMTYSVTRFGVYDNLKLMLASHSGNPDTAKLPCYHLAIAASLAGAAGGLAGNPADVILVRMTSDINHPVEKRKGYKNCFQALFRMIREEGFGSLTRGLGPNLSRSILMNASQLATYDSIKEGLLNTKFFHEGLWLHFCASSMAGAIATTICSPFDVVKSRIMNTIPGSATVPQVIRQSFRSEGVGWIFRGWTPAFIRLGPNTV
ncbi:Mitochondrial dicarboxylate transporter [Puccinia graminis f. sp. tritici]|nr:Mitochondrial dicarboxylate transporter [Puccinia graminis f. sp. tritici]